jgi:hypothetical protein
MLPQQNSATFRETLRGSRREKGVRRNIRESRRVDEFLCYSSKCHFSATFQRGHFATTTYSNLTTGIDEDQGSSERTTGSCGKGYNDRWESSDSTENRGSTSPVIDLRGIWGNLTLSTRFASIFQRHSGVQELSQSPVTVLLE